MDGGGQQGPPIQQTGRMDRELVLTARARRASNQAYFSCSGDSLHLEFGLASLPPSALNQPIHQERTASLPASPLNKSPKHALTTLPAGTSPRSVRLRLVPGSISITAALVPYFSNLMCLWCYSSI